MKWLTGIAPEHDRLLEALAAGHVTAAIQNQNASSVAFQISASCGGSFEQSVASALLTLGTIHAPVAAARRTIYHTDDDAIRAMLERGEKVPGWGNSFYKTTGDPAFDDVTRIIRSEHSPSWARLRDIGELIFKETGRTLHPNAAALTAVACHVCGVAPGTELMLFVAFRLPAWAALYDAQKGES